MRIQEMQDPVPPSGESLLCCKQGVITKADEAALALLGSDIVGQTAEDVLGLPPSSEASLWLRCNRDVYTARVQSGQIRLIPSPEPLSLPDCMLGVQTAVRDRLSALLLSLDFFEKQLASPEDTKHPSNAAKTENQEKHIAEMRRTAFALVNLCETLEGVALSEMNAPAMRLSSFDPAALCREMMNHLQAFTEPLNIRLRWEIPDTLPPVHWDKKKAQKALYALLSYAANNALEGQEVTFSVCALPRGIRITVTDQGGKADCPGYGELFAMHSSHPPRHDQLYVGIPYVACFTADHQGRLALSSRPGRTAIALTLPLQPDSGEVLRDVHVEYDNGNPRHLVSLSGIHYHNPAYLRKNFPKTSE